MKAIFRKSITMLILLSIFSYTLFDAQVFAASSGTLLPALYLSQLTPNQWVDQWYEYMNRPNPVTLSMNCGPTVVVMLEAYFKDINPTPERILEVDEFIYDQLSLYQGEDKKTYTRPPEGYEYCGPAEGVNTADLKLILQEFMGLDGVILETGQTIQDIKDLLDAGSPVIVPVNKIYSQKSAGSVYHFTLVRGYDGERFCCNDPGKPDAIGSEANFTFEEFEDIWQPGNRILALNPIV